MAGVSWAYGVVTAMAMAMDIALQLTVENLLARYTHAIDDDNLEAWQIGRAHV